MFNFLRKLSKKESKKLEDCLAQNGLAFDSQEEAEAFYFAKRDKDIEEIKRINEIFPELLLDFKAPSLSRLENFYFKCYIDKTVKVDISRERFEELMTQYMRQVFVNNEMAEWSVSENYFAEGRYELGLLYGYGSGTNEHYAQDLYKREDNQGRDYLYRDFMMYVPDDNINNV